jgi:hypothetical protein
MNSVGGGVVVVLPRRERRQLGVDWFPFTRAGRPGEDNGRTRVNGGASSGKKDMNGRLSTP